MTTGSGLLIIALVVLGGIAVGVGGVALVLRRGRGSAPPAAMPAAGVAWQPIEPDPRLLSRFTGAPLDAARADPGPRLDRPVGAAAETVHRGHRAVAFSYGLLRHRPPPATPGVEFTAIVSLDLAGRAPTLRLLPRAGAEAATGLDERFDITTDEPRFAHAVLDSPVAAFLLGDPRARYYPVLFEGGTLNSWTSAGVDPSLPMRRVDQMLDYLVQVLDRVPATALR